MWWERRKKQERWAICQASGQILAWTAHGDVWATTGTKGLEWQGGRDRLGGLGVHRRFAPSWSTVLTGRGSEIMNVKSRNWFSHPVFLCSVVLFAFWHNEPLSFGTVLSTPSLYLPPSKCQYPVTISGTPHIGKVPPGCGSWPSNPGPPGTSLRKQKIWIQGRAVQEIPRENPETKRLPEGG